MELSEATTALERAETLEQVTMTVRKAARQVMNAEGATVVLRDVDKCFYVDEDAIAPLWKGQRFAMTECISGWAMLHGEPAVIADIELDERIPIEAYRPTFVRSLVMVPVGPPDAQAAIGAYWARTRNPSQEEVDRLQTLAHATAEAIGRIGLADAPWAPSFAV